MIFIYFILLLFCFFNNVFSLSPYTPTLSIDNSDKIDSYAHDSNGNIYYYDSNSKSLKMIDSNKDVTTISGESYKNIFVHPSGTPCENTYISEKINCLQVKDDDIYYLDDRSLKKITKTSSSCSISYLVNSRDTALDSTSTDSNSPKYNFMNFYFGTFKQVIKYQNKLYIFTSFASGNQIVQADLSTEEIIPFIGSNQYSIYSNIWPTTFYIDSTLGFLYFYDGLSQKIIKLNINTGEQTPIAGGGSEAAADGVDALNIKITNNVNAITRDANGDIYFTYFLAILKIENGKIKIIKDSDVGLVISLAFYQNKLYYSDFSYLYVRSINQNGDIEDLIGDGYYDTISPSSLFIDTTGLMYVADNTNSKIFTYNIQTGSKSELGASSGPNEIPFRTTITSAYFKNPLYIFSDTNGDLYISSNVAIRKYDKANNNVDYLIGKKVINTSSNALTSAPLTILNNPQSFAFSPINDDIYIANTQSNVVCRYSPNNKSIVDFIGDRTSSSSQIGANLLSTKVKNPYSVTFSSNGDLYITLNDGYIFKVAKNVNVPTTLIGGGSISVGSNPIPLNNVLLNNLGSMTFGHNDNTIFFTSGTQQILYIDLLKDEIGKEFELTATLNTNSLKYYNEHIYYLSSQKLYELKDNHVQTESPTSSPTLFPTQFPTFTPTYNPTFNPTESPTSNPTYSPTFNPTHAPTSSPTRNPTFTPTQSPTSFPTHPTFSPTSSPTNNPTHAPTSYPTSNPTSIPTQSPTSYPTSYPTSIPTQLPTSYPTSYPTSIPTQLPTSYPSSYPTSIPTHSPTSYPTSSPTSFPTISIANLKISLSFTSSLSYSQYLSNPSIWDQIFFNSFKSTISNFYDEGNNQEFNNQLQLLNAKSDSNSIFGLTDLYNSNSNRDPFLFIFSKSTLSNDEFYRNSNIQLKVKKVKVGSNYLCGLTYIYSSNSNEVISDIYNILSNDDTFISNLSTNIGSEASQYSNILSQDDINSSSQINSYTPVHYVTNDENDLSRGDIAGIIIGSIVGFTLLIVGLYYYINRVRSSKEKNKDQNISIEDYSVIV